MKIKSKCCERYRRKAKACKGCPLFAELGKRNRRKRIEKLHRQLKKAA